MGVGGSRRTVCPEDWGEEQELAAKKAGKQHSERKTYQNSLEPSGSPHKGRKGEVS